MEALEVAWGVWSLLRLVWSLLHLTLGIFMILLIVFIYNKYFHKIRFYTALREMLLIAREFGDLACGLGQATRALKRRQGRCCLLATCDKPIVEFMEAICAEQHVILIRVNSRMKLDEWVGLSNPGREGNPSRVVGYSCKIIKDYGQESWAKDLI